MKAILDISIAVAVSFEANEESNVLGDYLYWGLVMGKQKIKVSFLWSKMEKKWKILAI